ncbi:T9SS type A sorting domain-containing protein [candidate division WOR-3 bacterium]|nr:T9SS type A sorting domain-containing protein [candidate division WOR-3 bacterium]
MSLFFTIISVITAIACPLDPFSGDSPLDPAPPIYLTENTGRGLGDILLTIDVLALGIDGPSGLSWDGQYLYVASLLKDSVFVLDPFVPAIINKWATDAFAASPYGVAFDQNLWVTHISPDTAREYTVSGTATGNAFCTEPSGALYCADGSEWWQSGEVWFIGIGSACGNQAIKFSVPSGTVLDSIGDPAWTYISQRGMTYDPFNQKFWIGGWNSDSVWELNTDGSPTGRTFFMDGCAGIAYDWQSTYHPTPVLWISRQAADQIVMVDADNPAMGVEEYPVENSSKGGFRLVSLTDQSNRVEFRIYTPAGGQVHFSVYDIIGCNILERNLVNLNQGYNTIYWDRKDEQGHDVSAGVYFVRLNNSETTETGKFMIML